VKERERKEERKDCCEEEMGCAGESEADQHVNNGIFCEVLRGGEMGQAYLLCTHD